MARGSREEKRAFWTMTVQLQAESGLSVREFCQREGISQASFFNWRRKLRQESAESGGSPSPDAKPDETLRLAPVRVLPNETVAAVEVAAPNGLILRVHNDADSENVRRVLQLMHEIG